MTTTDLLFLLLLAWCLREFFATMLDEHHR